MFDSLRWHSWLALPGVLAAGGCASSPVPDPFVVPMVEFYERVDTIVATPVILPDGVEASDSVLSWFEGLIESTLLEAGFAVVPVKEYVEIWNGITERAGGFFDPFTGERDEPRYKAGVTELFEELQERFSPDAVLYPEMWIGEAPVSYGFARWDGVAQKVGGYAQSTVLALSLVLVLQDMDGVELYSNGWGLELLELYDSGTGDLVPVPSEDLFTDQDRSVTAVNKVLGPLIDRRRKLTEAVPEAH